MEMDMILQSVGFLVIVTFSILLVLSLISKIYKKITKFFKTPYFIRKTNNIILELSDLIGETQLDLEIEKDLNDVKKSISAIQMKYNLRKEK